MNEALKYLQGAHGVLHGNLCPRSVFVTREWIWKLGGFAFAERLASESVLSPLSSLLVLLLVFAYFSCARGICITVRLEARVDGDAVRE